MAHASNAYRQLAGCSRRELERILVAGETPSLDAITGWEYRGYNHPRLMSLLRIRKFIKCFFAGERGEIFGCNTPARQNGLHAAWIALPDDANPRRFGFFRVAHVEPESRDNAYLHALLLDYGRGGNRRSDVTRLLRDYVVRVQKGSDDLLLGKAYLALGPARLPTSFFLLERHRPLETDPAIGNA